MRIIKRLFSNKTGAIPLIPLAVVAMLLAAIPLGMSVSNSQNKLSYNSRASDSCTCASEDLTVCEGLFFKLSCNPAITCKGAKPCGSLPSTCSCNEEGMNYCQGTWFHPSCDPTLNCQGTKLCQPTPSTCTCSMSSDNYCQGTYYQSPCNPNLKCMGTKYCAPTPPPPTNIPVCTTCATEEANYCQGITFRPKCNPNLYCQGTKYCPSIPPQNCSCSTEDMNYCQGTWFKPSCNPNLTCQGTKLCQPTPSTCTCSMEDYKYCSGTLFRPSCNPNLTCFGSKICSTVTVTPSTGSGLKGSYYKDITLTSLVKTRIDPVISFSTSGSFMTGVPYNNFSVRWTGYVKTPTSGSKFTFQTYSDDGVRVWINNQLVINNWTSHSATYNSATLVLNPNTMYPIKIEYYDKSGTATMKLLWSSDKMVRQTLSKTYLYPN